MVAFILSASTNVDGPVAYGVLGVYLDHGTAIDAYNALVDQALASDEKIVSERSNEGVTLHETVFTMGILSLERHEIKGPLLQLLAPSAN